MAGKYLLDTNILIALLGEDPAVLLALNGADAVFVPVIALGELLFGAAKSRKPSENISKVE